jgi:hypothetical protein
MMTKQDVTRIQNETVSRLRQEIERRERGLLIVKTAAPGPEPEPEPGEYARRMRSKRVLAKVE